MLYMHPLLSSGVLVYAPPCLCHAWVNWPACADVVVLEISRVGSCTWPPHSGCQGASPVVFYPLNCMRCIVCTILVVSHSVLGIQCSGHVFLLN
jgi:hypothetical protein